MLKFFVAPTLALVLAGCSTLEFPFVYRIDVEQGNILTQEMVDQLKPGMSKSQVEYVMGSALLRDTFHEDRWDYVYTRRDGRTDERTRHRLSVFFENDRLVRLAGDYRPGGEPPATQIR
ncbi:MAG: outer membrane protein assembly factor BamE [Spongiibacteraceae bacterium]|jgi:outer membrane protein assembly factor BamE|nr:outer membrane protein assembly factor BamE [Spongiibacteraceae bacterium]